MLKIILITAFLSCVFLSHSGMADKGVVGPGLWSVLNIKKCPEDASMSLEIDVKRHKVNRTHDGFDAKMKLEEPLDDSYALRVDICQHVDGGCKPYQVLMDNSFINFVSKYAESNAVRALELANVDPPWFPVPKGTHQMTNFIMDYDQLPVDGPYGEYTAAAYLLKGGLEKGCVEIRLLFKAVED